MLDIKLQHYRDGTNSVVNTRHITTACWPINTSFQRGPNIREANRFITCTWCECKTVTNDWRGSIHTVLERAFIIHSHSTICAQFDSMGRVCGSLTEAEAWANQCLSLPLYPELTAEQQHTVVDTFRQYRQKRAA